MESNVVCANCQGCNNSPDQDWIINCLRGAGVSSGKMESKRFSVCRIRFAERSSRSFAWSHPPQPKALKPGMEKTVGSPLVRSWTLFLGPTVASKPSTGFLGLWIFINLSSSPKPIFSSAKRKGLRQWSRRILPIIKKRYRINKSSVALCKIAFRRL